MDKTTKETFVLRDQLIVPFEDMYIKNYTHMNKYITNFIGNKTECLSTKGPSRRVQISIGDKEDFMRTVPMSNEVVAKAIKECPLLDSTWKSILGDNFNLLVGSMIFFFYKKEDKFKSYKTPPHRILTFFLTIFLYSFIQLRQFKFNPNESAMISTIDNLSDKFLIKKSNTMFEMLLFISDSHIDNMNIQLEVPNDANIKFYIQNLNNRISSTMKNITNEFMKNYESNKRKGIANIQETDESGKTYLVDIKNISADIESSSRRVRLKMASSGKIETSLLEIAAKQSRVSSDKMIMMLSKIFEDKSNNDILGLISSIISYYLTSTKNQINSIKSLNFISTMKSAYGVSNTKNEYIISIKRILDFLIDTYSSQYTKTMKKSTLSNARGCLFFYVVLYISRYIE